MKNKRFLALAIALVLVIAVVLVFSLRGCVSSGSSSKSLKVGVAVYKGNDTFISNMIGALTDIVNEYEKQTGIQIDVKVDDAQENQTTQNSQIERYIALEYDVLIVNLVDRTDASYIIDKAMDADIPIVFFNREPVQGDMQKWDRIFYVGSDARESAEQQAQIVIDIYRANPAAIDLNGDGVIQYIMLEGESRHQDAMIRTEYSVQRLRDAGLVLEKLDGAIANWDRDQAAGFTNRFMTTYGDQIELIICNNDDMALGAADAIADLGIPFNNIVGIDGTDAGRDAVNNGLILGTVQMDLWMHAQTIFDLAYTLATDGDVYAVADISPDKSVRVPMSIYVQ